MYFCQRNIENGSTIILIEIRFINGINSGFIRCLAWIKLNLEFYAKYKRLIGYYFIGKKN